MRRFFLFVFAFIIVGCSSDEELLSELDGLTEHNTEEISIRPTNPIEIGRLNAVKKAYQMTDLEFTPLLPIEANTSTYQNGITYKGLIYSFGKEIGSDVGINVSFHTFMTAIHNPHSKIYTDIINLPPYHGINCKSYYGTVCSGLVSYALGLDYGTFDFPVSDSMEEVDYANIDSLHIADILWSNQHVALITNVCRNSENHVKEIEVSEAIQSGCKRATISAAKFVSKMNSTYQNVFRYKEIARNLDYQSIPQFVAVLDETPLSYAYNKDLCVDKGDRACYREDEDVIVNIHRDYNYLDVYKDGEHYLKIDGSSERDVNLKHLPYGDYKAYICYGSAQAVSEPTFWKVANMELTPDRSAGRIYFSSANAIPDKINFSDITGKRKYPHTQLFCTVLTEEDRSRGYIEIPNELTMKDHPYIHFFFSTEYGKIQHSPFSWFE